MFEFLEKLTVSERLLFTVGIIFVVNLLYRFITFILHRRINNVVHYYNTKTTVSYLFFLPVLFGIIYLWVTQSPNISTYIGMLSAGIAIALRDIFLNIASWILIISRKPFTVGDRIQVGPVSGDVIDQRVFHFTLLEIRNWVDGDQSTGRIVHVPNFRVFSDSIANYTKGFNYLWNEIQVTLTLDSNWQKAKQLLQEILNTHFGNLSDEAKHHVHDVSRKYMIYYNKMTPTVYTAIKGQSIQLSLRYLCEVRGRRNSEQLIWETILTTFKEHQDIQLK